MTTTNATHRPLETINAERAAAWQANDLTRALSLYREWRAAVIAKQSERAS